MKEKTQAILLAVIIILILLVISAASYSFIIYIPGQVSLIFGTPSDGLDNSQIILLSARLYFAKNHLINPISKESSKEVFIIHPGESGSAIASSLSINDYIHYQESFVDYLIYRGIDRVLQSGIYLLSRDMSPLEIAESLYDPNPEDVAFSFPSGWRVEEIAGLLPSSGINVDPGDIISYVKNPPQLIAQNLKLDSPNLEGFLFPGEYQILRSVSVEEFVKILIGNFSGQLPADYEAKVARFDLSLHEAIILASIVEKETVLQEEAPIIAGVFINRLELEMPLQSDPTVQYTLGYSEETKTWWKNPLTSIDLEINSPFNTYRNMGLPPAPICNPGMNSLLAVANAAKTDYLFFRSACDGSGSHVFSKTYQEHLSIVCE